MVKINKELAFGPAPALTGMDVASSEYKVEYTKALNWLTDAYEADDFKSMVLKELETRGIDTAPYAVLPAHSFQAVGKVAWMVLENQPLSALFGILYQEACRACRSWSFDPSRAG